MDTLRIYVACLASYNNGTLHGVWIDCDGKDADDLQAEVSAMLRESKYPNVTVECPECNGAGTHSTFNGWRNAPEYSPCETCKEQGTVPSAEEYAIHDHEGFGPLIEEYTSLARVAELAEIAAELDDEWPAYIAYAGHVGGQSDADDFRDAYRGEWRSLEEYADDYIESCGLLDSMPENLRYYFDTERFARDLEICGDVFTVDADGGNVYVFYGC